MEEAAVSADGFQASLFLRDVLFVTKRPNGIGGCRMDLRVLGRVNHVTYSYFVNLPEGQRKSI